MPDEYFFDRNHPIHDTTPVQHSKPDPKCPECGTKMKQYNFSMECPNCWLTIDKEENEY